MINIQYQLVKEERDYIKSLQLICDQGLPFLLSHPTCFCSLVKLYMCQYNLQKLKKFLKSTYHSTSQHSSQIQRNQIRANLCNGCGHVLLRLLVNRSTSLDAPQCDVLLLQRQRLLKGLKVSSIGRQSHDDGYGDFKSPNLFGGSAIIDANQQVQFCRHELGSIVTELRVDAFHFLDGLERQIFQSSN